MRATLVISLLLALISPLFGQAPKKCVVCDTPLTGQPFYWVTTAALPEKQAVCETCSKLDTTCSHCRLPVTGNAHKLEDGRWLCKRDYAAAIFSESESLRVFEAARRDVQRMLHGYGELPDRNITVSLVNSNDLAKLNVARPSWHTTSTLLGLTRTRLFPGGQYQHSIFLLNGLSAARLASVSAHEYAHAWIHENVQAERKLDPNAVEGFCELVAYKLAVERQEAAEKRIILANAYTRGQINSFVQAENNHQFHRVVGWMKSGVDELLPQVDNTRLLTLRDDDPAPLLWPPPPLVPTAVPDTLMLKGISGTVNRRFILINDRTLMKNEMGRVRVGTSNVVVRCLDIKDRSAVIEVQGTEAPLELVLVGN